MFMLFMACILWPMKHILTENNCLSSKNGTLYLQHDQSLTIPCFLNDSLDPNATLYFTRDDEPIPAKQINSSFISLNLEKAPISRSVYTCKYGDKDVCANTIIVDSKPVPATNFKCIFYNLRNLTCTWLCPESFLKTDYNLVYYFSGSTSLQLHKPCLNLTSHEDGRHMSCSWMLDPKQQQESVKQGLYFEMTMTNIFGTTVIKKAFLHYEHLLFGPPKEVSCIQKTSNSLLLNWTIPAEAQWLEFGVQYRIMYRAMDVENDWKMSEVTESKSTDEIKYKTFNLTNLKYANSFYEIGISIRPISINQNKLQWSKNALITVKTMETVPEKPPTVDIGSFEIVSSIDDSLDLFVYWQEVKYSDRNGEDFTYYIELDDQSIAPIETTRNYVRLRNLNDTKDSIFSIRSKNNMGMSTEKATIFVLKKSERIGKPTGFVITPLLDGEYQLKWNPSNTSVLHVYSYTIFWCENNQLHSEHCHGDLNWIQTPGNITTHILTLNNYATNQFGISANTKSSSSGIVWNTCADFYYNGAGKLKNVWVNKVYSTSIEIAWRRQCFSRNAKSLNIYYCNLKDKKSNLCKGGYKNAIIPIDESINRANISDLRENEVYAIQATTERILFRKNPVFHPQLVQSTLNDAISYGDDDKDLRQPPDVKVTKVTQTSITIAWENLSGLIIFPTHYEIVCNNKSFVFNSTSTNFESFTITGLKSYTDYTIYVKACRVMCSGPSKTLKVTTQAGIPSAISHLYVLMQTESDMVVAWDQPKDPRGKNVFEVYYKKTGHRHPISYYTEDTCFEMDDCRRNKTSGKFWITVRAVNFHDGERFEGPWSEEFELYCSTPSTNLIWLLLPVMIIIVLASLVALWCMYRHYQKKLYVDVILPSGLAQMGTDLKSWGRPSIDETALASKLSIGISLAEENKNSTNMQLQPVFVNVKANRIDLIAPEYTFEEVNENLPCLCNSNQPDLLEYIRVGTEGNTEQYVQMGVRNNQDGMQQSNYFPKGEEGNYTVGDGDLDNKNSYGTNLSDDEHRIENEKVTNNITLQQTISNGYIPIGTDLHLLGLSVGEPLKKNSYEDLTEL